MLFCTGLGMKDGVSIEEAVPVDGVRLVHGVVVVGVDDEQGEPVRRRVWLGSVRLSHGRDAGLRVQLVLSLHTNHDDFHRYRLRSFSEYLLARRSHISGAPSSQISPAAKMYAIQVEYANKAVENSGYVSIGPLSDLLTNHVV